MSIAPARRKKRPLRLFLSYSHKNVRLKDELLDHLRLLEYEGLIKVWQDRNILPDKEWEEKQLLPELKRADIVLMLVSGAFCASHYCFKVELPLALQRMKARKCIATWVLLSGCNWKRTPLAKFNSWPVHGKTLPAAKRQREAAWADVAEMIADYVERHTVKPRLKP